MADRYLNLDLAAWRGLRRRFAPIRVRWKDRLAYRAIGSTLALLPATEARPQILPPIVLVGHWRSGTTLLHELVTASSDYGFPTTGACMNPHRFLAGLEAFGGGSRERPMDNMTIAGESPQEDEFSLFCLGAPSPLELLLFPQVITDIAARSDPAALTPAERLTWERTFLAFLAAVQSRQPGRRLVLKSPPHSFRIAAIRALCPDAQFVAIRRDPESVFPSTRRLWREMWKLYALTAPPPEKFVDAAIMDTMLALDRALKAGMAALPAGNGVNITYEEMVTDPRAILYRIGEALSLDGLLRPSPAILSRIAAVSRHARQPTALTDAERAALRAACTELFV